MQQALKHLPVQDFTSVQAHRLKVWLAAKRADVTTEREELEQLLAEDFTDRTALARLAQLAEKAQQRTQADESMRRKAEIDRLQARYEQLYDRNQPIRDAEEMASLAEQLGRKFEARVFLTVVLSEEPERDDLRQNLQRLMTRRSKSSVWRG